MDEGNVEGVRAGVSVEGLLRRPVVLRGIRLGRPTDVALDAATLRAVGFDIRCGDGVDRFLPLPAARLREREIAVGSALMLLDEGDAAFYRRGIRRFGTLVGARVERRGELLGTLRDVLLGPEGTIQALRVAADGRTLDLPFDESLTIGSPGVAADQSARPIV